MSGVVVRSAAAESPLLPLTPLSERSGGRLSEKQRIDKAAPVTICHRSPCMLMFSSTPCAWWVPSQSASRAEAWHPICCATLAIGLIHKLAVSRPTQFPACVDNRLIRPQNDADVSWQYASLHLVQSFRTGQCSAGPCPNGRWCCVQRSPAHGDIALQQRRQAHNARHAHCAHCQ